MISRYLLLSFLLLSIAQISYPQKVDKKLEKIIKNETKSFNGEIGVYIFDTEKNKYSALNADTIFPTASVVKIPILLGVMNKIQKGELKYHQGMTYSDSLYYAEGEDILASFKSGEKISISKLLMLMLSTSDNTASLWLQGLSGGGIAINSLLDSLGFQATRVNSRTEGRKDDWEVYGWGQTTPEEIARLMTFIIEKKLFSAQLSERMLRLMGRQYWDENAIAAIPPDVFIADKTGAVNASRNEVMYVNGPHPYILSIFTKNNKDQSWESNNEAWVLIRQLSAIVWKYFNPRFPYSSQPNLE